ncbi:M15 family metallopeptidase [Leptobacterium sp. I13]|uniref:M15 family metallopeptidase n=1 Tax=Leptobacterium meishanense TaxID=3128904 RepID=UPI0030EC5322
MRVRLYILSVIFLSIISCKKCKDPDAFSNPYMVAVPDPSDSNEKATDTLLAKKEIIVPLNLLSDTVFIRLADYSNDFIFDLKYATTDNFLKKAVYDCPECYVRVKTAKALLAANNDFMRQGHRIKFFDCYRPNDVQWKMWELFPNPQYVANPQKGSIHNRGGAVDITLVNDAVDELDMGTDFDYFGKEAHHDYTNLSKEVLNNRKLLKEIMEKHGFWSIRTEWWHYNLNTASNDAIANFKWKCK